MRERKPQRLCSFFIQEKSYLCWFFDREISGLGTLQNLVHENSRTATHRRLVSSIGHECTSFQGLSGPNGQRQPASDCQVRNELPLLISEPLGVNSNRLHARLHHRIKCWLQFISRAS